MEYESAACNRVERELKAMFRTNVSPGTVQNPNRTINLLVSKAEQIIRSSKGIKLQWAHGGIASADKNIWLTAMFHDVSRDLKIRVDTYYMGKTVTQSRTES